MAAAQCPRYPQYSLYLRERCYEADSLLQGEDQELKHAYCHLQVRAGFAGQVPQQSEVSSDKKLTIQKSLLYVISGLGPIIRGP